MKKMTSIALVLILAMSLVCAALADEVPQPEEGKKFETDWAAQNYVININYEEEGYRVSVVSEILEEGTGTEWFYICYDGGTRTVDVHIQTLRAKLRECRGMIETVRGVGYRFGGE